MLIHPTLNWVCLSPEPGNYTFGYYDRCPWDSSNAFHLAIRFPQQQRFAGSRREGRYRVC